MTPITEKEKVLVKYIVKQNSLDTLNGHYNDYLETLDSGGLTFISEMYRYIDIPKNFDKEMTIQYLHYIIQNYDKIKEGVFPNEIERCEYYRKSMDITRSVVEYVEEYMNIFILPSLSHIIDKVVTSDNMYDFDSEQETVDYGDTSDYNVTEIRKAEKLTSRYYRQNNVIN